MKTVLLLLPSHASFLPPLTKIFKELGWSVKFFDYRKGDIPIRILRFVPIFGGHQKAQRKIGEKIINLNSKFNPDLILTVKGELLDRKLINSIRNGNNKVVNWFPDPMNLWDLMVKIAPFYDYFLHFDPMVVKKLKSLGYKNVFYLPFAADIQSSKNHSKLYDVSFVGTYSSYRENILSKLKKFNLNIWGDPRWQTSHLKQFVKGGRIHQDKMKMIIKKSKINLNIHYNTQKEGVNLRTFEVTGCRSFLLTDYTKDMDNLFIVNRELVCYSTPAEMMSKVTYFLENGKAREKISSEGYKRSKKDHNYRKRIEQLLKTINE